MLLEYEMSENQMCKDVGEKEDKQGREDGLASQHALIIVFIFVGHPFKFGRSPWQTAFTNAVCFDNITRDE